MTVRGNHARRIAVLATVGAMIAAALVFSARPAPAFSCSCAAMSLDDAVYGSPTVFTGWPRGGDGFIFDEGGDQPAFATTSFSVSEQLVYEGKFTDRSVTDFTSVRHEHLGSDCGDPEWATGAAFDSGEEYAVLAGPAVNENGQFARLSIRDISPCLPSLSPEELRDKIDNDVLPEPTSTEPIAAVVWARHRWAKLAALDANGELVALGGGTGQLSQLQSCNGHESTHFIEYQTDTAAVFLWDLAEMRPVSRSFDNTPQAGPKRATLCDPRSGAQNPFWLVPREGDSQAPTDGFGRDSVDLDGGDLLLQNDETTGLQQLVFQSPDGSQRVIFDELSSATILPVETDLTSTADPPPRPLLVDRGGQPELEFDGGFIEPDFDEDRFIPAEIDKNKNIALPIGVGLVIAAALAIAAIEHRRFRTLPPMSTRRAEVGEPSRG